MLCRVYLSHFLFLMRLFSLHTTTFLLNDQRVKYTSPVDYLFIQNLGNTAINNPALKPTTTIDYELGFQQVISKSSSLKISAFYRETRDEIQVRNCWKHIL